MSTPLTSSHLPESPEPDRKSLSESALAWAAGFLDGEGCIHISKQRYAGQRRDTYRLGVYVTQNDRPVLEALREAVGIYVPIYPVKRAKNHSRQCFTLNFNGKSAMRLLALVKQHLRRKRVEAETALAFCVHSGMGVHVGGKRVSPELAAIREHYYLLMKKLK